MSTNQATVSSKQLRIFGYSFGGICCCLFGLILPFLLNRPVPIWPWIIGIVFGLWALVVPKTLKPVYKVWMLFGNIMGWINSRIILGILFYVIFSPIALVLRLMGKDPLERDFDAKRDSYRLVSAKRSKEHMERIF